MHDLEKYLIDNNDHLISILQRGLQIFCEFMLYSQFTNDFYLEALRAWRVNVE